MSGGDKSLAARLKVHATVVALAVFWGGIAYGTVVLLAHLGRRLGIGV